MTQSPRRASGAVATKPRGQKASNKPETETAEEQPADAPEGPTPEQEDDLANGAGPAQDEPSLGRTEVERLINEPGKFTLTDGTEVELVPLKTREFFSLMRIVTHGGGGLIMTVLGADTSDPEQLMSSIMGLLVFAIPEAEEESINFVRRMVRPKGADGMAGKDRNRLGAQLWDKLTNPSMEDLVGIIEQVLEQEKDELVALGKRLIVAIQAAKKNNLDLARV